jgi:ATP-dependent Clp protease protease subunit
MSRRFNKDSLDQLHDYGLYLPTRTIYMGSELVDLDDESGTDALMAEKTIKNLTILESLNNEPITIIANNPGGHVSHGLAIYDAIRACKSPVSMKIFGQASSMGSIILQAADERIMSPQSSQMIHYGSVSLDGEAQTVYKATQEYKRIDKWMEDMYLTHIHEKNPRFTRQKLQSLLKADTYLTAKESVALGLADKVLGDDSE